MGALCHGVGRAISREASTDLVGFARGTVNGQRYMWNPDSNLRLA